MTVSRRAAGQVTLVCQDLRVGIRVVDSPSTMTLLSRLADVLPGAVVTTDAISKAQYTVVELPRTVRSRFVIRSSGRRSRRVSSATEVVEYLRSQLSTQVAETARCRIFVHAGVVGWKGRAIVLPGRSGAGKTTLVAELLRAGATYYSDEYAVVDEDGGIDPFCTPLQIRSTHTSRKHARTHEQFGARAGTERIPAGLVVFATFRAGHAWTARALSPGNALALLLANTICARTRPDAAIAALGKTAVAPAFIACRGAAHEAAHQILNLLEGGA
ncbi:MAG TPA: hypothetical protein VN428_03155 [Bryobacteraceae bacterium]|nr:hypothetical protein [Bryobacteraceae bacterium]